MSPGWCPVPFPGLHVLSVCVDDSGGRFSLTVTVATEADVCGCPERGCVAVGHGRRVHTVAHTPCFGAPVQVRWLKRLWRCPEPGCPQKTFSEVHACAAPKAKVCSRAERWATDAHERDDTSVSALACHHLEATGHALASGRHRGPALSLCTGTAWRHRRAPGRRACLVPQRASRIRDGDRDRRPHSRP